MTREKDGGAGPAPSQAAARGGPTHDARARRLAAQLRANLKRRKEQARGRAELSPGEEG